jgi:hypothetical protein
MPVFQSAGGKLMAKLPSRCKKYSVGKEIGGALYVHRSYEGLLPEPVKIAAENLPTDFDYDVVKFVEKESCVSFVVCPDFDSADEPIVGDIVRIASNGSQQFFRQQADPFIYHHKWLFVMDDYAGFDVRKSKSRSITWLGLHDVDVKRIGRRSFWNDNVIPRLAHEPKNWKTSAEASQTLKISPCELSHMRLAGKLSFVKLGNSYFYDITNFR